MWAADGVLLAATFVWGTTFVIVRDAVQEVPPLFFIALRFTLAAVVLLPFALRSNLFPDTRALGAGAVVGFWLFAGFALQTTGLVEILPARAAFLTGLSVVLVPVLLVVVYRRLPNPGSLAGVLLATAGLALLTGLGKGRFSHGDLLVLGGAIGGFLEYRRSKNPLLEGENTFVSRQVLWITWGTLAPAMVLSAVAPATQLIHGANVPILWGLAYANMAFVIGVIYSREFMISGVVIFVGAIAAMFAQKYNGYILGPFMGVGMMIPGVIAERRVRALRREATAA